ncbi:O-methyltransferase [Natranaerobius thermophilus]|uniref:O-methyltransferase n=1 Tax=Natranaerobius thermophilus TaxID=375929 RepID=UPI002F3E867D
MDQEIFNYIQNYIVRDNCKSDTIKEEEYQRDDVQPSIELETGKFLGLLIRLINAQKVLEFGTCLGYSTIWLGEAVKQTGGKVISIEKDPKLYQEAKTNIEEAGLSNSVELVYGDISEKIRDLTGPYDIIFQGAQKSLYPKVLENSINLLNQGGVLVADDTLFKVKGAPRNLGAPVDEYNRKVMSDDRLYSTILPVGDGVTLSYKIRQ